MYGVFVALSSDELSYAELKDFADFLRRELLLVQDVAKIETYGEQVEAIYVELDRDRMSQLGIPPWCGRPFRAVAIHASIILPNARGL